MDWKETVMTTKQAKSIILKHCSPETTERDIVVTDIEQDLIEAQAEISLKAGMKSLLTELHSPSNLILAARQEGIREVVKSGMFRTLYAAPFKEVNMTFTSSIVWTSELEWQSFLESKGIK